MHSLASRQKISDAKVKDISERFWSKVKCGTDDECWLWQAHRQAHRGYGTFGIGSRLIPGSRHTSALAHRVAWELTYGPVPNGARVLHQCDNPPCCNPKHLFLGSQADNVADMIAKGRQNFAAGARYAAMARAMKTHCKHGHRFDENSNTVRSDGQPRRICRICSRLNAARRHPRSPIGHNVDKTHCIHGHPFDEANTYITPTGKRACRTCRRDIDRRRRLSKKR